MQENRLTDKQVAIMAAHNDDRRRWERLPVAVPVFVRGSDQDGKEFLEFATALNLSAGGALVVMRRYFPASRDIALEFPAAPIAEEKLLSGSSRTLSAQLVRVVNSERCDLWGLQFASPLI
jgi:hypothetical protein